MSYHSKRRIVSLTVYLLLTLVVVSVISVTVFTFISASRKKKPPVEDPSSLSADVSDTASSVMTSEKPSEIPSEPSEPSGADPTGTESPDHGDPSSDATSDQPSPPDTPTDADPQPVFLLPLRGALTRAFSIALPVWSETMGDYRAHTGVDIEAELGEPVLAIAAGLVREISDDPMMGRTVTVEHANGMVSVYANLTEEELPDLAVGLTVGAGQIIGAVGDTALGEVAECEHLHFELRQNGEYLDPCAYLDLHAAS